MLVPTCYTPRKTALPTSSCSPAAPATSANLPLPTASTRTSSTVKSATLRGLLRMSAPTRRLVSQVFFFLLVFFRSLDFAPAVETSSIALLAETISSNRPSHPLRLLLWPTSRIWIRMCQAAGPALAALNSLGSSFWLTVSPSCALAPSSEQTVS